MSTFPLIPARCTAAPSKRKGILLTPGLQGPRSLTWQEEGGPGGDVDLLKMLQGLRVEEADGGTRGESHPDTAASLHHVSDTHRLILVSLEALLRTEGMEALGRLLPSLTPSPHSPRSTVLIVFRSTS